MSETAPERPSGNVLTRKVGPLPMWGWMGIVLLVALIYYVFKKNKSSASTTSTASNAAGGVDSSLVPQFINQTYVNGTPPTAPNLKTGRVQHGPVKGGTGTVANNPVSVQVPNGTGGWMTVSFPSSQAEQQFYTSLGIGAGQPNGGYYPNGLTNSQLVSHVQAAGGSVTNPNSAPAPAGFVPGAPNTTY